jgi:thiol-disulfide isomerase/thioredoxin
MTPKHALLTALIALTTVTAVVFQGEARGAEGTAVGDTVPRFAVPGHDSAKLTLPVIYAFLGTTCPTTAKYLERLAALEKELGRRVAFVYVYPNHNDTSEAKKAFHAKHGLGRVLVDDRGAKVATLLGAQKTSEVILVSKKGRIAYRGAIDDNKEAAQVKRRHLAIAARELLAGKKVSTPKTEVFT